MPGPVQSIERAAAILQLLARGPDGLAVGEIARALDLAKGTTHGILRTLVRVGFVDQDEVGGRYRLSTTLRTLGAGQLDLNELRSRAINWADPLAARTGAAVRIGALREGRVLVVHHVFRPDGSPQILDVGSTLPAHASALGKALLAYAVDARAILDRGLEPYSPRTVVDPATVWTLLAEVRARGWAAEVEEMTVGQAGVAAPIRGYGGLVVGAVGVSGPVDQLCDAARHPHPTLVTRVLETARAISRTLDSE